MKYKFILFFCILSSFIFISASMGQNLDTSSQRIHELTKLKVYFINQSRKTNVKENLREDYKLKIDKVDQEIETIQKLIREDALQKGTDALTKFKKDSASLKSEFEMAKIFTPDLYPTELGAWNAGFQVSLLKPYTYTTPVQFYADKTINEKITAGFYFGHLTEINQYTKGYGDEDKKEWSYTVRSKNYTYSLMMFGLRGTYHFFNPSKPLFNLNPLKWDIYLNALLGFNLALKPDPFLLNRSFDLNTKKGGINFGVFPGVRYMADDRLGFYMEAGYGRTSYANIGVNYKIVKSEVVIEKKNKKKKGNSKGKNSKGKTKSKKKR